MHFHHLISVVADDEAAAVDVACDFLNAYENSVWDWYEVGGRWSGFLAGGDAVCAKGHEDLVVSAVRSATESRQASIRELRRYLTGPDGSDELYDPLGFGSSDSNPEVAGHQAAYHRESAQLFTEMLESNNPEDPRFSMVAWRMRKLGSLLSDLYVTDSMYFDAVDGTGASEPLLQRILDDPQSQWLVSVDLHN